MLFNFVVSLTSAAKTLMSCALTGEIKLVNLPFSRLLKSNSFISLKNILRIYYAKFGELKKLFTYLRIIYAK